MVTSAKDMSLPSSKNSTAHPATARRTAMEQLATNTTHKKEKENGNEDVWLQRFTPSTFSKMHSQIYPIIEDILLKPEHTNHPFQTKWHALHSNDHKPAMASKMSWRQMTQCLGISDFSQYKDFVYNCPEINTKITIIAHKNTIEFGIRPESTECIDITYTDKVDAIPLEHTHVATTSYEASNHDQSPDELTDSSSYDELLICTEQSDHIGSLMQVVIPFLKKYVNQSPEDDYSCLCQEWFSNGLSVNSSLEDIQKACHITCLEDLYLMLTLSPSLKGYMKFKWDRDHIKYSVPFTVISSSNVSTPTVAQTYAIANSDEWQTFHSFTFSTLHDWALSNKNHYIACSWNNAICQGMTQFTTWAEMQDLLNIENFMEYYYYINACPTLKQITKIHLDITSGTIYYRPLQTSTQYNCPSHLVTQTTTPQRGNITSLPEIPKQPDLTHPRILIPSEMLQLPTLLTRSEADTTSEPSCDDFDINSMENNFEHIHSILYHTVEQWTHAPDASKHKFYTEWTKAKYLGITSTSPWNTVSKILKLNNYEDYIQFITQCPNVMQHYKLTWDKSNDSLQYKYQQSHTHQQGAQEMNRMTQYYQKMQHMAYLFESKYHDLTLKIDDINAKITCCEYTAQQQAEKGNHLITSHTNTQLKLLLDNAVQRTTQFTSDLTTTIEHHTNLFQTNLTHITSTATQQIDLKIKEINHHLNTKIQEFHQHLETLINDEVETAIQEIHDATDKATQTFTDNEKSIKVPPNQEKPAYSTKHHSALFPNVDPELYADTKQPARRNPFQLNDDVQTNMVPSQHTVTDTSEDEWGRFGPNQKTLEIEDHRPLPALHSYKLVNHIRVPYTGRDSSYTWYYTFRIAVQQYGILLIPIEQFKKDRSLCPRKYYGTKIDALRYKDMADALYQLLALTDTVSMEHTEVCNIIHRHASNTDGYSALYEIMERIHPILNADAKLSAPLSINCTDIHEYYNRFDSYLLHNSLKEVYFTPRRQINIFLEGLDSSYATAISQIRQQLRTWRDDETKPPPDLCITSLARTIECIMQEESNIPTIRVAARHRPISPPKNKHPKAITDTTRQYVDIQCTFCKSYGHKKFNCDKMSQFLILQEMVPQVDEKMKTKLMNNYHKLMQARRANRLTRIKGTVRQLYTDGQSETADALWDTCMDLHEDTDSASTSSSK